MEAENKPVWSRQREREIALQDSPLQKGRQFEVQALNLTELLEDVDNAWLAKTGSSLDQCLNVDLVVEIQGTDYAVCVQCIDNADDIEQYLSLGKSHFNGKEYGLAPIVTPATPVELLYSLSEATGLLIKPEVDVAINLAQALFGKEIPARALDPKVRRAAIALSLAEVHGSTLKF